MTEVVVLGAGVVGLAAAITLLAQGRRVEVWTRDDPLATTSSVAAAIWFPFLAEPRDLVIGWSAATFATLQQQATVPASGVHMTAVRQVFAEDEPDLWWLPATVRARRLPASEVPAPCRSGIELSVPLCDTRLYLPWLLAELRRHGGRLIRREVRSFAEPFTHADIVVNCTGLGARDLCGDRDLHAVRGQVLRLRGADVPWACIDDTGSRPCYVVPRHHDVVVGGTAQHHDERLHADAGDSVQILDNACRHHPGLRSATVESVGVGLRPYRSRVRLELEAVGTRGRLVHDYGHGGSGFTLAWGCAASVRALLTADPPAA